jgi:PAS domain S-box-containing protein
MDLERFFGHTADGVMRVNLEHRIVFWNQAAEKILGYSAQEVMGKLCYDVFAGRNTRGNRFCYPGCQVMTMIRRGELVQHFDMATRTKNGQPIWINVSTVVVPSDPKGGQTVLHLFRDVTTFYELEGLMRKRLAEVQPAPSRGKNPVTLLTRRQLEILRSMANGANTKAMAEKLHISPMTVRNHIQNILPKLGVHSRLEAVVYATTHGLQ